MPNFFQKLASLGSSPFRDDEEDSKAQLQELGVDTQEIDTQFEQEVQQKEQNFLPKTQVLEILNNAPEGVSKKQILVGLVERGFELEGFTAPAPREVETIDETEQPTTAIGAALEGVDTGGTFKAVESGVSDVLGGAISKVPEAISNVAGFLVGKPIDFLLEKAGVDAPSLEAQFKEDGLETKEAFQEKLGVDPESFATDIGEFGAEIGLLFIPGGQAKLATKFPKAAEKIGKLGQTITKLGEKAPKTFNVLKSALIGSKEAAKFGVVSEGDISPTGVAIGAVANPIIQKTGKVITGLLNKDVVSGFNKVIRPSSAGKKSKFINENMEIIGNSLKSNSKKPQSIVALYDDLVDINKKLYTKHINPALETAKKGGSKVDMKQMVDDIFPKISEAKKIKGKDLSSVFGRSAEAKEFTKTIEEVRKMGKLDFLEAETLKQYLSALSISAKQNKGMLSSLQEDFVQKLNQKLGGTMDDAVKKITGTGINQFKREYVAISSHLDDLNRRIIAESKLTGDSLFSGLGKIAGIREIVQGNVTGGLSQILTGEILKKLKDPDEILKKVIAKLYEETSKKAAGATVIGVGAGLTGEKLDKNQREKLGLE